MNRSGAAPLLSSTALLVRLRLRRLANQLMAGTKPRKKAGDKTRTGNAGKKSSKIILYLGGLMMLFGFGTIAASAISNLHHALDVPDTFWVTVEFSTALTVGVAFLVLFLWTSSLLLTIASGELAKPDWDLEWLITLPIRSETLFWARILERSVVNPSGAMTLMPVCTLIAWFSGYRWAAPIVGLLAAWPLLLLAALARTLLDTGLRLTLQPGQLRNLHAIISVLSIVAMYLAISMGLAGKSDFMLGVAAVMPDWLAYTPMGLTVRAINERGLADAALLSLTLLAEVGVIVVVGGCTATASTAPRRHRRQRARVSDAIRAPPLRECQRQRAPRVWEGCSAPYKIANSRCSAATGVSSCRAW